MRVEELVDLNPEILFAIGFEGKTNFYFKKDETYYLLSLEKKGYYGHGTVENNILIQSEPFTLPDSYGAIYIFDDKVLKDEKAENYFTYNTRTTASGIITNLFFLSSDEYGVTTKTKNVTESILLDTLKDDALYATLLENKDFKAKAVYLKEIEKHLK